MNSAEIGCFIALFIAFYITVIHPFIVGICIIGIIGYIRYFIPKIDEKTKTEFASTSKNVARFRKGTSNLNSTSDNIEVSTESEQQPQNVIEERRAKKSQREILREIQEAEERKKYSKLLLTYQVPNMTAYYESLVRIIQN